MKQKTFQFEYVNDKTWASLIEQSVGPVKSYTALPSTQSSRLFSVALVSLQFHLFSTSLTFYSQVVKPQSQLV